MRRCAGTEEYMDMENIMGTEVPTLSFDVVEEPTVPVVVEKAVPQENDVLEQARLSEAEKQMVKDFVEKIDLSNTNAVLQYGAATQKKMADFPEKLWRILNPRIWAK